jgi:hypothetical protein
MFGAAVDVIEVAHMDLHNVTYIQHVSSESDKD